MIQTKLYNEFRDKIESLGFKEFPSGSMKPDHMYLYVYSDGSSKDHFEFTIPGKHWEGKTDLVRTIKFFNYDHDKLFDIIKQLLDLTGVGPGDEGFAAAKKVFAENGLYSYNDLHNKVKDSFNGEEHTPAEFCKRIDAEIEKVGYENLYDVGLSWPTYTNGTLYV